MRLNLGKGFMPDPSPDFPALLTLADSRKEELDKLRPLQPQAVKSLQEAFDLELMVASNQIEGSTLTLRETQLVLEKGVTIGGKPLRDHLDAVNQNAAWKLMLALAEARTPITENIVLELHKIILTNIDNDNAGKYRQSRVFIKGAQHVPPNPLKIPELLEKAWADHSANKGNHPISRMADLHYQISAIHPFVDGNGRTARLILNLGLIQNGYPPAQILADQKMEYFDALAAVDTNPASDAFRSYIARTVIGSLESYLKALTSQ